MAGLEFGFSFNPQDAPQRHCFYDSDEEVEVEDGEEIISEDVFSIESLMKVTTIKLLVIGNTQPSCSFLSSHVITEPEPFAVVKTKCPLKVLKGKYFTRDGDQYESDHGDGVLVSKLYYTTNGGTSTSLCLNENAFKEDYCNSWSKTVSIVYCCCLLLYVVYCCCLLLLFIVVVYCLLLFVSDIRLPQTPACPVPSFPPFAMLFQFRIKFR